ncbi:MAG: hypothetical protein GX962_09870 [Epulopiscium sp.]|nr:hypothetical protein [Candidatus Epulonipiscium sp.]
MKKLAKDILSKHFYDLYFRLSIREQLHQKEKNKNHLINKFGFRSFVELDTISHKKSDTLFIMGSGNSINYIDFFEWNHIKNNDSLGINSWIIHDHIATFYMFEMSRDPETAKLYIDILDKKCKEFKSTPFILKSYNYNTFNDYKLPEIISRNIYLPNDIEIPIRHIKNMKRAFSYIENYDGKNFATERDLLWKSRASISMAIFFAFYAGYKNIVLCGVDLNNTKYFYDIDRSYYEQKGLRIGQTGQSGEIHKTMRSELSRITIDKVIYEIDTFLKKKGVNLYVQSKKSALYPKIKHYNYKTHL